MRFSGGFTSKRGTFWNYDVNSNGWVTQWHPTMVECTGGSRSGPDTFSPKITRECFEAIEANLGFKRNPDSDDEVIVTDLSRDEQLAVWQDSVFGTYVTASRTPDGEIRMVLRANNKWGNVHTIRIFPSVEDVDAWLRGTHFSHYERIA